MPGSAEKPVENAGKFFNNFVLFFYASNIHNDLYSARKHTHKFVREYYLLWKAKGFSEYKAWGKNVIIEKHLMSKE